MAPSAGSHMGVKGSGRCFECASAMGRGYLEGVAGVKARASSEELARRGVVLLRRDQRVVVAKLFRLSTFFIVATRRLA